MMTVTGIHAAVCEQRHLIAISADAEGTCLLFSDGGEEKTQDTVTEVLEKLCLKHGSTLQGRMDAFCRTLDVRQKPCILLSERSLAVMMPLQSLKRKNVQVVLYNDVCDVEETEDRRSRIVFAGGAVLETDASVYTVRTQMKRCESYVELLQNG